ncbi:MAG: hypothetical protein Q9Q40_11995 [Acidobacteriota bacterium]|nr:hypothetical protein [Acidobacteriota bacterium]
MAAEAGDVISRYRQLQASHLIEARSVVNEASFGLFSTTIDQINDPTRLADIQRDEPTPVLGRPGSGGDGTPRILFTGLANRAEVHAFQVGGIYGMESGNLAGYLAWRESNSDSRHDSGSSYFNGNQADASATELMLAWGQRGETSNWGVTGSYLSGDRGNTISDTSSVFWDQSEASRYAVSGAFQNHAREDFTWTVSGNVASGDMIDDGGWRNSLVFNRLRWDFDTFTWGGGVRLNWYQEGDHPGAFEVVGSYDSMTGDLNHPTIFMRSNGVQYDETATRDDFSASNATLGLRWQKQLAGGVDFGAGFMWDSYEIDADFAGNVTDTAYTPAALGRFVTQASMEGDTLSIPTSVRAGIGEKWTVVVGAEFWRSEVDIKTYDLYPSVPVSEDRLRSHRSDTGTDYAMALRYQHGESVTAELGFHSGSYVGARHTLQTSEVTFLVGVSY